MVVDPRRTDTAEAADLHLALLPGTDVALYNAMLHVMLWEGWIDRDYIDAHTAGFEAVKRTVREATPRHGLRRSAASPRDIERAAELVRHLAGHHVDVPPGPQPVPFGSYNNAALINLHLATAQIGKPGAGPFSLTGQPNAMGGREVGGLANLLSGHRDLANPAPSCRSGRAVGRRQRARSARQERRRALQGAQGGEIKAVWIACTNPAQSMPDQTLVHEALRTAEFVVVQEAFVGTETCAFADLLLPAATWGEKDGTVTNSSDASAASARLPPCRAKPVRTGRSVSISRAGW